MQKSRFAIGLSALVMVGALAACSTPAAEEPAPEESSTAVDIEVSTVNEGQLTFATTGAIAPYTFTDVNGALSGYDVELCNEIAARLGLEPSPQVVAFNQTIAGVQAGQYDMVCSGTAVTPERAASTDFYMSSPTAVDGTSALVKADSDFETIEDLRGANLGGGTGASQQVAISNALDGDITVTEFTGNGQSFIALQNGQIDAVAVQVLVGMYNVAKDPSLRLILPPVVTTNQATVVSRTQDGLIDGVNAAIAAMFEDGTIASLQEKYFGEVLEEPES